MSILVKNLESIVRREGDCGAVRCYECPFHDFYANEAEDGGDCQAYGCSNADAANVAKQALTLLFLDPDLDIRRTIKDLVSGRNA